MYIYDLMMAIKAALERQTSRRKEPPSNPVPIVNPIRWQLIENRAMLLLDV